MSDRTERGRGLGKRAAALPWIGALVLIAGLAVGGLALVAPMGVWFGAWNFSTGFGYLGTAHGYAPIVAGVGLAVTIGLAIAAQLLGAASGFRPAVLALVGTIAAALAYYVPESHRPPDGTPGIHDIATDTADPPQFVAVLPLRGETSNTVDYGNYPNMTPERLAETTREAYPDLTTVQLAVPPDQAFERALAAVRRLGWDLVAEAPAEGRIEATDTTFWFRFKDDVVIRIRPSGDGGSLIDARSTSRVGVGDAGTNARRLREFFEVLTDA